MNVEELLAKLVSFPVLGGESNLSILNWINDYLKSYGIQSYLVPNNENNKASLHCRIGPPVDGGVILSGHMDVVPVDGQDWKTNPFILTDKGDGKLYGRGACDMKGFLACCLAAIPEIINTDLQKPLYFAFSYDEEIGCLAAPELARAIKKHYKETPKYAIIGEPSMMEPIIGQKGIYIMDTYVHGSAGHSSRIKQEVSAIHEAMRLILWLESKMDSLIKQGITDKRFHPPHTTIHIGQVNGGIAPNVIADKVHFCWDIRTIPKDSIDQIVSEFKEFDKTIQTVLDFAEKEGNTLVIVTADHETGGLALTGGNLNQSKVKGKFNTGGHSATMVPVFSYGPNSKLFSGIYENTAIFDKMRKAVQQ